MEFVIRDLKPSDFADVVANYYSYYEEVKRNPELGLLLYSMKPSISAEFRWFAGVLGGINEGNVFASVAEADKRVVGLCDINPLSDRGEQSHVGCLGIAIIEEYRNKGIGTELMKHTLSKARKRYEIVVLDVFTVNKGARHLYEKMGFRSAGIIPSVIKRNGTYYDEERMYIRLQ